jgi:hypothetical protein
MEKLGEQKTPGKYNCVTDPTDSGVGKLTFG